VTSKAEDSEIQATASVLSLKCPLSATRIATPCRATSCAHNQCFDAASYLMLQEQAPQWSCPLCNKPAPFNSLTIDLYVDNILKSTSSSVEQVTIEPNGSWHQQRQAETPRRSYKNPTPDNDDDLIEISDDRISSLKADARTSMLGGTPPMFSREPSSVSSAPRSNKRQISQVIDLTGSDDEDEQPPQKIKRPSISSLTGADPYRVPSAGPTRFYTGMPSTNTYNNFDFADSPL
jgi:E3 SUMO-protein ligase PIAS1